MILQLSHILLFGSAILSFHLWIFLSPRTRESRSGRLMSWLMVATSLWALFNGLELMAPGLWTKFVLASLQYGPIVALPVIWYRFGVRLQKKDEGSHASLGQWDSLLWLIPLITFALVWLDPWLGLVRHGFSLKEVGGLSTLDKQFGPWFWVHSLYSYTIIILGTIRVVQAIAFGSGRGQIQAWILAGAALIPTGANLFYLLDLWPLPGVDPTPIAFSITGVLFVLNLAGFRFLALIPAAQDAVISSLDEGVLIFDRNRRLVLLNNAASKLFGLTRLHAGRTFQELLTDYSFLGTLPVLSDSESAFSSKEVSFMTLEGGKTFEVRLARVLKGNAEIAQVYTFHDITLRVQNREGLEQEIEKRTAELKEELDRRTASEKQLFFYSLHDPLTHLPNRSLLINRLTQLMERFRRDPVKPFAVLYFDFDNFKLVNDAYGHEAGDAFLREVAKRLTDAVRTVDTVSRIGGDEFVVLLDKVNNNQEAEEVAERIADDLAVPINYEGNSIFPSTSVGVLPSTLDYNHPEDLLRDADLAMYHAKNAGKNRRILFQEAMRSAFLDRTRLTADLKHAIVRGELELHYQPVIRLSDGAILGCEALVRWNHPELGRLSPDRFIPLAEESGLVVPLGLAVFIEACQTAFEMKEKFPGSTFFIAVNISALQLAQGDIAEIFAATLGRHGLKTSAIHLEITESALVERAETVLPVLQKFRDLGFKFKLDDFGTGYSSLAYLHRFPIDTIKIDRSFVMGLDPTQLGSSTAPTQGILRGIISLGHELGKDIIAEGIETEVQGQILKSWGCDFAQGYLYSRPVPRDQWMDKLTKEVDLRPEALVDA